MNFREVIKLQFEKEPHPLFCNLKLFTNIILELSLKNACLPPIPQFSFWISIALVKIYISFINRGKNTFELVGTVLNRMPRDTTKVNII